MSNMQENNGDSKVRKIIFNEVTLIIALVSVTASVIFWVQGKPNKNELAIEQLKTQIESHERIADQLRNIKDNDLHTLEVKVNDLDEKLIKIMVNQTRMEVLLNQVLEK